MSNYWKHGYMSECLKLFVSYDIEKGTVHFIFGKGVFGQLKPQRPAWKNVPKEKVEQAIEAAIKTEFF